RRRAAAAADHAAWRRAGPRCRAPLAFVRLLEPGPLAGREEGRVHCTRRGVRRTGGWKRTGTARHVDARSRGRGDVGTGLATHRVHITPRRCTPYLPVRLRHERG